MKNLAIVIGVPEYKNPENNLLACKMDAESFRFLLDSDGRYDDILYVDSKISSGVVKEKISQFIESHTGSEVEDFLFYFSGHGEFHKGELYFLLSDFEESKRRQTSLSNQEVDSLVRSLNPSMYSKIIDACQSGVSYIKSKDNIEFYMKSSQESFKKLYFLFSSQSDQYSYQSEKISFFTESIIRSVINSDISPIRYKDVMSFVADEFEKSGLQTPLFVTQADFTEKFVGISEDAKVKLNQMLASQENIGVLSQSLPSEGLVELVKREANRYCTEEVAISRVNYLLDRVREFDQMDELIELYEPEVENFDKEPPNASAIGKWLVESREDIRYFANPRHETESYERPKVMNALASIAVMGISRGSVEYETAYRKVTKGFSNS